MLISEKIVRQVWWTCPSDSECHQREQCRSEHATFLFTIGESKFLGDIVSVSHMCLHFVVQCPQKIDKLTAVHPYFPSTVTKAFVKLIKQHTAAYYSLSTSLLTLANRGSITSSYIHSALPLRTPHRVSGKVLGTMYSVNLLRSMWSSQDHFGGETRNTSIAPSVLSTSLLEDWPDNGICPFLWHFVSHFPRLVQNSVCIG